jgi:hypothetical protein
MARRDHALGRALSTHHKPYKPRNAAPAKKRKSRASALAGIHGRMDPQRLYETFRDTGLFVSPIPDVEDPDRIAAIWVSAGLLAQQTSEKPAARSVSLAMKGPKVAQNIHTAHSGGDDEARYKLKLGKIIRLQINRFQRGWSCA